MATLPPNHIQIAPQQTPSPHMPTHNPAIPKLDPDSIIPWIMDIKLEVETLQVSYQIN